MHLNQDRQQDTLFTERLIIRRLSSADLIAIHRVLSRCFNEPEKINNNGTLRERESWLQWTILSYEWYEKLHQPPYGERAVVLKSSGELIGAVGFVSEINLFGQITALAHSAAVPGFSNAEVGIFWAIDPDYQRLGYASEAAARMLDFAFRELKLTRLIASTDHDNLASQAVMKKIGMQIYSNPIPEPAWLQTVAVIYNPQIVE